MIEASGRYHPRLVAVLPELGKLSRQRIAKLVGVAPLAAKRNEAGFGAETQDFPSTADKAASWCETPSRPPICMRAGHFQKVANRPSATDSVAHRLSTIRHATRVVVMSDGEITEIVTHKELLDRKGSAFARN